MVRGLLMQVKSLWSLRQGDYYAITLYVCYIPIYHGHSRYESGYCCPQPQSCLQFIDPTQEAPGPIVQI